MSSSRPKSDSILIRDKEVSLGCNMQLLRWFLTIFSLEKKITHGLVFEGPLRLGALGPGPLVKTALHIGNLDMTSELFVQDGGRFSNMSWWPFECSQILTGVVV